MPRAAACVAASTGSGPALLAPSVRSTTIAGAYAPFGTAGGATASGSKGSWLLATDGSTSAMASIASRIALPTAVRRPVCRLSMTSSRTSWSFVGAWTISA